MNILPVNLVAFNKSSISKRIKFKSAIQTMTNDEKYEINKQIDDIRKQIKEVDKSLNNDINQIESQERQIKDDETKQISALEREKDDLKKEYNSKRAIKIK